MTKKRKNGYDEQYWKLVCLPTLQARIEMAKTHQFVSPSLWLEALVPSVIGKKRHVDYRPIPYYQQNKKFWERHTTQKANLPDCEWTILKDGNHRSIGICLGSKTIQDTNLDVLDKNGLRFRQSLNADQKNNDLEQLKKSAIFDQYNYGHYSSYMEWRIISYLMSDPSVLMGSEIFNFIEFDPEAFPFLCQSFLKTIQQHCNYAYTLQSAISATGRSGSIESSHDTEALEYSILQTHLPLINACLKHYNIVAEPLFALVSGPSIINQFFDHLEHQLSMNTLASRATLELNAWD